VIRVHHLAAWFNGVLSLRNDDTSQDRETVRDLLLIMLLLGLRRSEALNLRWADVDLGGRILTIPNTKSHDPKVLPFGPYLADLFRYRLIRSGGAPLVFAASLDPKKPIVEPRRVLAQVTKVSGLVFTPHDLRRSFATHLEGLDVSAFALRRLMGHKTRRDDVTEHHYVVTDVERLRPAIEKLESFLLSAGGVKPQGEVTELAAKQGRRA
jgi:integrase